MAAKFGKATEEARRYAEQHDLERLVQQMVNSCMATKPEDPQAHMLRYLLESSSAQQVQESPVRIVQDVPPPKQFTAPDDRTRAMYNKLNTGGKGAAASNATAKLQIPVATANRPGSSASAQGSDTKGSEVLP
mmetsp:Transcript_33180/g.60107  ORF Transcript_33180/g.60107 Transcript_33180/m.60107 type:complete len:133 (+) Transcript_33180:85-483(+)|eukprot:CAMPEP_0197650164 /NCGR_PEP_ID=MMETSP1338-20131121/30779_1 /TAXON_ID=43686 ORGANISM="Pelagodinium beii, Strain RCC1491" /NCGR_SAMPLE_ID=MMETSP1338 /ASSEMBLY_ACC=CAM_ASM_000754 /LENGTH=132 /DNA_ID=CAMNT_0043224517 /DNA_START=78 /DNA_END=476 /DNA_ORIENTATION=+